MGTCRRRFGKDKHAQWPVAQGTVGAVVSWPLTPMEQKKKTNPWEKPCVLQTNSPVDYLLSSYGESEQAYLPLDERSLYVSIPPFRYATGSDHIQPSSHPSIYPSIPPSSAPRSPPHHEPLPFLKCTAREKRSRSVSLSWKSWSIRPQTPPPLQ